jgi:hypothetical protein
MRLRTQEGADLIEDTTEACSGGAMLKSTHGTGALFNAAMVLLQVIVQVASGPMGHLRSEHSTDRPWIAIMPIGRDPVGRPSGHGPRGAAADLRRWEVPHGTEPHIDQVSVPINRLGEIWLPPLDAYRGRIGVPTLADSAPALLT